MKELICTSEAMKLSGFSRYFVKILIKEQKLKCKKIGKKTLIPRKEFMAVLKKYEI